MQAFARLYADLDATTSTDAKVDALVRYLAHADPDDAAWAVYFLAGGRPRRVVPTAVLRAEATALADIGDWLFDACHQRVGDLAETIALLLPPPVQRLSRGLAEWMRDHLLPLRAEPADVQAQRLREWLLGLPPPERFLLVKLIGGGFRVGVSRLLVERALARHSGLEPALVAQRMMGWTDARLTPSAERLAMLLSASTSGTTDLGQPYPFFLAHALPALNDALGPVQHWMAEWKYDGIRAQVVRRAGRSWIWSRGEELVTERFPDVVESIAALPDGTVLDGELLVWLGERPGSFGQLQPRILRKTLSRRLLDEAPVRFIAYDLLEHRGLDVRGRPQHQRRQQLEALLRDQPLLLSPIVPAADWSELGRQRDTSRERGVEGLMLKHRDSVYGSGRTRGAGLWWKWKVDPMSIDGVLIYAQAGHGRRSGVYTDYTFAVWNRAPRDADEAAGVVDAIARGEPATPGALQLVSFAKAYSGLTDEEFRVVDARIRATTLEKFGPVRSVRPSLVFTLGFEGIQRSTRHKSGIALRFPRMLQIRHDKPLHEADTLDHLTHLLEHPE